MAITKNMKYKRENFVSRIILNYGESSKQSRQASYKQV